MNGERSVRVSLIFVSIPGNVELNETTQPKTELFRSGCSNRLAG